MGSFKTAEIGFFKVGKSAQCMESHANSGDMLGVEKAFQNVIDQGHGEDDARRLCGQALFQALSFSPNLDDGKKMWSSVDILLKCNADVDYSSAEGQTPLLQACCFGMEDIVEVLIHSRADVNKASVDGWTPLLEACDEGHGEIVNLLLKAGASVKQPDFYGRTPKKVASESKHAKIVKKLVLAGAK